MINGQRCRCNLSQKASETTQQKGATLNSERETIREGRGRGAAERGAKGKIWSKSERASSSLFSEEREEKKTHTHTRKERKKQQQRMARTN